VDLHPANHRSGDLLDQVGQDGGCGGQPRQRATIFLALSAEVTMPGRAGFWSTVRFSEVRQKLPP